YSQAKLQATKQLDALLRLAGAEQASNLKLNENGGKGVSCEALQNTLFFSIDPNGQVLSAFDSDGAKLSQYKVLSDLLPAENADKMIQNIEKSISGSVSVPLEGTMKYMVYSPLGADGCALLTAADYSVIEDMAASSTSILMIFLFIVSLVAIALMLVFILKESALRTALEQEKNQLEISEQEYRVVADHCNQMLFRFFPKSGSVQLSEEISAIHGLPRIIENSPELSIKNGLVDSSSADTYLQFFKSINSGKPSAGCEIKCNFSTGTVWYNMEYTMISGTNGEPYAVISAADITERKNAENEILKRSMEDSLTGALNRKAFEEKATEFLKQNKSQKHGIVMLDLDNFKGINDNFGHIMGDNVLFDTCARLSSTLKEGELISRPGGDEFMLLLKNIAAEGCVPIDARLQGMVDVVRKEIKPGTFTSASLGFSIYPDNGKTFEELYRTADLAVYSAKENGRNQYVIYSKALEKKSLKK
ncbi:MAG: GGDEF domain-containing protein, partial [Oscillospiraceae bacterium]